MKNNIKKIKHANNAKAAMSVNLVDYRKAVFNNDLIGMNKYMNTIKELDKEISAYLS